jgi:hypothetical protein
MCTLMPLTPAMMRERMLGGSVPLPYGGRPAMSTWVGRAVACASDSPPAAAALAVATKPRRERSDAGMGAASAASGFASVGTGSLPAGFFVLVSKASLYGTDRTAKSR